MKTKKEFVEAIKSAVTMLTVMASIAFRNAFKEANRENQFTPYALGKLFDYLEDYKEQTGEKVELDVISLCCEYIEFESLEELQQNYNVPEYFKEAKEYLEEHTQVIYFEEDCILIQRY